LPPALVSLSHRGYSLAFAVWMLILHLANIAMACRLVGGDGATLRRALGWSLGFCCALGPVVVARLDHLVGLWVALSGLCFARCAAQRSAAWAMAAGAMAAAGVLTKIVPGVAMGAGLLLLLLPWSGAAPQRRQAGAAMAGAAVMAGLMVAAWYLLCGAGIWRTFSFHLARGIQLESVGGGLVLLLRAAGALDASVGFAMGSVNVSSSLDGVLRQAPLHLMFAGLLLTAVRAWQGAASRPGPEPGHGARFSALCLALMLVFVLVNKVLSPQFLIWLMPLTAGIAASGRRGEPAGVLLLASAAATHGFYPWAYRKLWSLQPGMVLLLNLRNLLLLAMLANAWWRLPRDLAGGDTPGPCATPSPP